MVHTLEIGPKIAKDLPTTTIEMREPGTDPDLSSLRQMQRLIFGKKKKKLKGKMKPRISALCLLFFLLC